MTTAKHSVAFDAAPAVGLAADFAVAAPAVVRRWQCYLRSDEKKSRNWSDGDDGLTDGDEVVVSVRRSGCGSTWISWIATSDSGFGNLH